jgi:hypothetical protein
VTLARRLAKLEVLVQAQQPEQTTVTFWTPERVTLWKQWASRLLETMGNERAQRVYAEMTDTPPDEWGPVARRVHHLASLGADGHYHAVGWPHWASRTIALPDAVCEALERHPDAAFTFDYSCEGCGLEVPYLPYYGPALLPVCPLCDGAIRHCGYTHRRLRDYDRGRAS